MKHLFLFFAMLFASLHCSAASFDCGFAETKAEWMVCIHPGVSKLDEKAAEVFQKMLKISPPAEAKVLRDPPVPE